MAPRKQLRPKPEGYKPSGRKFNMLEQTPGGEELLFGHPGSAEYRKVYNRAASLFDAEGHHVVDLAYIDQLLYNAGFPSGASGTEDYSEIRNYIIEEVRKKGVDLGNVPENIVPLSQRKTIKGVEKTGMAHKWVHDLYNMIPEDSPEKLQSLTADQLVDYIVDRGRTRKQLVIDAMVHKVDALYSEYPKLRDKPVKEIQSWIRKNKQIWGQLGDRSFKEAVGIKLQQPEVPGQAKGRVPFPRADVEELMLGTTKGFMSVDPLGAAVNHATNLIKKNIGGSLLGAGYSLTSPDVQAAVESGNVQSAAIELGKDILSGAAVEQGAKLLAQGGAVKFVPQAVQRAAQFVAPAMSVAGPVSLAATVGGSQDVKVQEQKFEQYAETLPPQQAAEIKQRRQESLAEQSKPLIDGNQLFKSLTNELKFIGGQVRLGQIPYFN